MTRPPQPAIGASPVDLSLAQAAARTLHTAATALAYFDRRLRLRFANPTLQRWLGTGAGWLDQPLGAVLDTQSALAARSALLRAAGGESAQYEGQWQTATGPARYVRGQFEPDRNAAGQVVGVVAAFSDLSQRHALEVQLRKGEQRYAQAFQHAAAGMALVHPDGQVLQANRALAALLGCENSALASYRWRDLLHPDDAVTCAALAEDLRSGRNEQADTPIRLRHRDGHEVPALLRMSQVRNDAGAQHCLVMLVEDATQRRHYEQAVARESAFAEAALDALGDAVVVCDAGAHIVALNPVAEALTGWRSVDARGRLLGEVCIASGAATAAPLADALQQALDRDATLALPAPLALRHQLGFDTAVACTLAPMRDAAGGVIGAVLSCHDLSETRELTLRLIQLARRDALTGLPGVRSLPGRAERAVRMAALHGWRCALLQLGLDGFRRLNAALGDATGDHAMQALARGMRGTLRDGDSLYRGDGDEFLVLMPRVDALGAASAQAARLAAQVAAITPEGAHTALRASIGVSLYPDDADDADALRANADAAMHAAKAGGGGVTRYFGSLPEPAAADARVVADALRHALANHALSLHYQPRVDAASGRVLGAEALLRWQADGRDVYVPDQLIPVAEDSGLIVELGTWVLREACAQARHWRQHRRLTPISVNVTARQLRHERFCAELDALMAEFAIGRGELELELSGPSMLTGGAATAQLLDRIRQRGVHLALDDFGSDYGSVACLARTPADTLKIDRRLVRNVACDDETGATAREMIALARSHRKTVIAKGVETPDQAAFLRTAACNQLQGFYCGAPMPATALEQRLLAA